jgi:putative SOS response-associated peptidase YedK
MCGRFVSTAPPAVLADYLRVDEVRTEALDPSWNVAPTDRVYAVSESSRPEHERLLGTYKWGLVPSWAKDVKVGARMINARAETLESKFKAAYSRRRCLLPADGFYEWEKKDDGKKQPWFIHRADGAPMVFGGLWEIWRDPEGPEDAELLRTCTIVTTSANDLVARIHDRMPVVISPSDWDRWLDRTVTDPSAVRDLLAPADPRQFEMFEVSPRVNSVRNNDGDLLLPLNSR